MSVESDLLVVGALERIAAALEARPAGPDPNALAALLAQEMGLASQGDPEEDGAATEMDWRLPVQGGWSIHCEVDPQAAPYGFRLWLTHLSGTAFPLSWDEQ